MKAAVRFACKEELKNKTGRNGTSKEVTVTWKIRKFRVVVVVVVVAAVLRMVGEVVEKGSQPCSSPSMYFPRANNSRLNMKI